jgi:hypothetical protein
MKVKNLLIGRFFYLLNGLILLFAFFSLSSNHENKIK